MNGRLQPLQRLLSLSTPNNMYAKTLLVAAVATLTLAACDKDEVNNKKDNPTPMPVPGQVQQTAKVVTVKNVGMTPGNGAYANWTYVNLATGEHETHPDFGTWTYINTKTKEVTTEKKAGSLDDVKIKWDLAFRYNMIRTNNGATKLLAATEFNEVKTADMANISVVDTIATGKDRVMVDFANMMNGILTYTSNDVRNPVLSTMFTRKGQMPNISYEPKPNVVALRTNDGRHFLLKFKGFTNNAGTNGFYTFDAVAVK